jgi:predicted Zn-dependent protease with MMP-like domain
MSHRNDWDARVPPSLDDFLDIAQDCYAELPAQFRALAGDIIFRVEEFASDAVLADMGIDTPYELSGLYYGVDLTQRSLADPAPVQPMVFLYRSPILAEWCEAGDLPLGQLISHILVHEIGHHFGLSDEKMEAILAVADGAHAQE